MYTPCLHSNFTYTKNSKPPPTNPLITICFVSNTTITFTCDNLKHYICFVYGTVIIVTYFLEQKVGISFSIKELDLISFIWNQEIHNQNKQNRLYFGQIFKLLLFFSTRIVFIIHTVSLCSRNTILYLSLVGNIINFQL